MNQNLIRQLKEFEDQHKNKNNADVPMTVTVTRSEIDNKLTEMEKRAWFVKQTPDEEKMDGWMDGEMETSKLTLFWTFIF